MKSAAKCVALALMLLLFAAPAIACLLPGAQLTQEERACCAKMAAQCGEMGMDSSHSCCNKVSHSDLLQIQATRLTSLMQLAAVATPEDKVRSVAVNRATPDAESSPPESPPGSTTILRI